MLLLRFRCETPPHLSHTYVSYGAISKAFNISYNSVQHICRYALKTADWLRPNREVRKLSQEHIEFLTSYSTLEKWAGFSLKWRTRLFHRHFPDKRIAVTTLRKLYLKNDIRRKKVRQEKHMPVNAQLRFRQNCQDLLSKLDQMQRANKKIIYLDEINFTKRSLCLLEWSHKNSNLAVDQ